jgi:hypothetical protein
MVMEELCMLKVIKLLSLADIAEVVYAITLTQLVDLTDIGWFTNQDNIYTVEEAGILIKTWRQVY